MAKPPIGDLPPVWGDAGNYPASNYPVTLPDLSGQANPLQGATPWSGQPRLNAAGLGAYASAGFTPQVPNDPSPLNEWFRRVQVHVSWVQDGTSAADATAHIMETDASGFAAAVKYIATAGIEGAGASPVILIEGASVPVGKAITGAGSTSTDLHVGDSFQLSGEAASTGNRQIHYLGGEPRWRDGDDEYLHHGDVPWGPVASVPTLDTAGPTSAEIDGPSVSVTLPTTGFVFVSASGTFVGTAGDTAVGIRVEVDGVDIYDQSFPVFNTDRALVWSTSFSQQEGAGTFDVKIKLRRSAGTGSVSLAQGAIFAMPY
jgi:hypothetical protein